MNQENMSIIESLHRPANSRLKTVKHVCKFIKDKYKKGTNFRAEFFIYIFDLLIKYYQNDENAIEKGLLSRELVDRIKEEFIDVYSTNDAIVYLINFNLEKDDKSDLEKNIFTALKTVMYYVTLSKAFLLTSNNYQLTEKGKEFVSFQSHKNFIELTTKEKLFLFESILEKDYTFFLPLVYINKIHFKYKDMYKKNEKWKIYDLEIEFISKILGNNKFLYKKRSWKNYIWIRNLWINDLECIGKRGNIKPSFEKVIKKHTLYIQFLNFLKVEIKSLEKNHFKNILKYKELLKNINSSYKKILKQSKIKTYKFISLYEICDDLNLSYNKMQWFLNELALDKDNWIRIHLHNVIGAADSRKRFFIKSVPVINIKINEDLK